MQRPLALATMTALMLGSIVGGATAAQAASAATISDVSTTWSGSTVAVEFSYDTWDYARVDVTLAGSARRSVTLPAFDLGEQRVSLPRSPSRGATPITIDVTSCDTDPVDPAAVCTTVTAYQGTVLPKRAVPRGKADALRLLGALAVRAESHTASYDRDRFKAWNDADRDGEDTRAEVLKAESTTKATVNGSGTVKTGRWVSAYDGRTLTRATQVEVDHVVALAEAWRSGAWGWTATKREAFGNDLGFGPSLVAVSKASNRAKSDDDPSSWLPADSRAGCVYARNYVAVKARWRLSVDRAEKDALIEALAGCTSYAVAKSSGPAISTLIQPVVKRPKPRPVSSSGSKGSGGGSAYYTNCDAARAAGAAPVRAGDPGYGRHLDRDGDGIGCE